jgi:TIR domain
MSGRDHHSALKTETVSKVNAGYIEIVFAKLQWGKNDKAFTLHVNPTSYSSAGLQNTDWLRFLGFERNDKCPFTNFGRCYSKEVPEGFDVQAFATAFNAGFGHLQKAERSLEACGFVLPQPEGWGFYHGTSSDRQRRRAAVISGDGHTAMKTQTMKTTEDDKFLFRFTFIDTGHDKAFVTHYRPKHPPLSSELRSVFKYLGLLEFKDCPEFEFEPCYFRTLQFLPKADNMRGGNVEAAHQAFDAHDKQFSSGIENLLAANSATESVGMMFLPLDRPTVRMQADIASNLTRSTDAAARTKSASGVAASSVLPDSFDVAISFAGTERPQAEKLAEILRAAGYAVFYDDYYPEHLWGKDLPVFFDEIFRKRARFCVIFVSKEYRDRKWTSLEARSAQARALEEKGKEYILPIRVDDTELAGLLPTVGYVPLASGIDQIGGMLLKKLQTF